MDKKEGTPIDLRKEGLLPQEEMLEVETIKQQMVIGIPKEDPDKESRVPLTPEAVEVLTGHGVEVIIEAGAGIEANYPDNQYAENGALITDNRSDVFQSDIVLKINPPNLKDIELMKERITLISSLQVKSLLDRAYIDQLIHKRITALSLERVQDDQKCFPFIRSMSGIAGNTAILIAGELLRNVRGGKGVMLGGITGITPTEVIILGAGTVAEYAVKAALGMGSTVKVFDESVHRLRRLQNAIGEPIATSIFHPKVIEKTLKSADVVIGAVRNSEENPTFFITEEMVQGMKKGTVIIDISIDSGGCVATSELRSQKDPIFTKYGVVHYCVPNIPSSVARTASIATSNVVLPMIRQMGKAGSMTRSLKQDSGLRNGVYIYNGILTNEFIGNRFSIPSKDINLLMAAF